MPDDKPDKPDDEPKKPALLEDVNSVKTVAHYLKVSKPTIYRWITDKKLAARRTHPGKKGRVLIRREAVLDLLNRLDVA